MSECLRTKHCINELYKYLSFSFPFLSILSCWPTGLSATSSPTQLCRLWQGRCILGVSKTCNIRISSIGRWKARSLLPIRDNWTFFTSCYGSDVISKYWSKSAISGGRGHRPLTSVGIRKLTGVALPWTPVEDLPALHTFHSFSSSRISGPWTLVVPPPPSPLFTIRALYSCCLLYTSPSPRD